MAPDAGPEGGGHALFVAEAVLPFVGFPAAVFPENTRDEMLGDLLRDFRR